jgi:hypothetical protein
MVVTWRCVGDGYCKRSSSLPRVLAQSGKKPATAAQPRQDASCLPPDPVAVSSSPSSPSSELGLLDAGRLQVWQDGGAHD